MKVPFKVLDIKKILKARIGVYTYNIVDPTVEFYKSYANYHMIIVLIPFFLISSSTFILTHQSEFTLLLKSGVNLLAGIQCTGMFLSLALNKENVVDLHSALQEIVDEDNGEEVNDIYWKCEQKCQRFTKMISAFVHVQQAAYITTFCLSIVCILIGNLDTTTWPLPVNLALPFNSNTLLGWYAVYFIYLNMEFTYGSSMIPATSLFVSSCIYICAIYDHFDLLIHSTSEDVAKIENENNPRKICEIVLELRKKLGQSIDIHNKIYEVFNLVADINSLAIFALLPINAVYFATILYTTENAEFDAVALVFNLMCVVCATYWQSFYCIFANMVTDKIADIGFSAYDSEWYAFPLKLQKYNIVMIARSQEEINFTGLNLMYCTLEYFGKLMYASWSYYINFRNLSKL